MPPYAVIACSTVFFWSISVRALIYTVMPTIASDLRLSNSAVGIVIGTMLFGYSAGSWMAGWIPAGRKRRIVGGILLSLLGTALFTVAGHLAVLLGAGLAMGLGLGIYLPLGLSLLVEAGGSSRTAYYMSLHEVAATLGSFAGSAFVAVILFWTDWHGSALAWGMVGLLSLLVVIPVKDRSIGRGHEGGGQPMRLNGTLLCCVVSYGVGTILVMGLISMLPLIMVRAWGLDQAQAASLVGNTRLAGLLGVALAGGVADRWGHTRVLLVLQLLSLLGCVAMAANGHGPLFDVGILVLAVGASGNITLLPAVVALAHPPEQRERAIAIASGVGGFFGMVVSPAFFGILLDVGLSTGPIVATALGTLAALFATSRISAWDGKTGRVAEGETGE